MPWIYWQQSGSPTSQTKAALLCSTLIGTFFGQFVFGFLGDIYGRRKMYGLELFVLIVGSVGTAMASEGANDSMSILGWLVFWRIFMGTGIGADYPIVSCTIVFAVLLTFLQSAVITSEFAPRKHRARMLAFVFWMQAIGQVLVYAIALIVLVAYRPQLSTCLPGKGLPLDDTCISQLDRTWRWVVGLGAVPAAIAIFFRVTIPQSPRFLMDAEDKVDRAAIDTAAYYGPSEVPFELHQTQHAPLASQANQNGSAHALNHSTPGVPNFTFPQDRNSEDMESQERGESPRLVPSGSSVPSIESVEARRRSTIPDEQPYRLSWWADFSDYFFTQGNWRLLAGTAGNWFLLDFPFYGLELSSAALINKVWVS